nr:MAG TPA: hypothetical protein [Caudoviricetes sp.]
MIPKCNLHLHCIILEEKYQGGMYNVGGRTGKWKD